MAHKKSYDKFKRNKTDINTFTQTEDIHKRSRYHVKYVAIPNSFFEMVNHHIQNIYRHETQSHSRKLLITFTLSTISKDTKQE